MGMRTQSVVVTRTERARTLGLPPPPVITHEQPTLGAAQGSKEDAIHYPEASQGQETWRTDMPPRVKFRKIWELIGPDKRAEAEGWGQRPSGGVRQIDRSGPQPLES